MWVEIHILGLCRFVLIRGFCLGDNLCATHRTLEVIFEPALDTLAVECVLAGQLSRSLSLLALVQANVAVTLLRIFRFRWQILDLLLWKPPSCLLALRHHTGTEEELLQRNATSVVLRPKLPEIWEKLPWRRLLIPVVIRLLVNMERLWVCCYWSSTSQICGMTDGADLGRLTELVDRNGDWLSPGSPGGSSLRHCLLRRETGQLTALRALRGGKGRGGRVLLELGCLSENFTVILHRRSKEGRFLRSLHWLLGLLVWTHAWFQLDEGWSAVLAGDICRLCPWGYVDHGFEGAFASVTMEGSGGHSVRYWRIHYFFLFSNEEVSWLLFSDNFNQILLIRQAERALFKGFH